jgi:hypothetical protein
VRDGLQPRLPGTSASLPKVDTSTFSCFGSRWTYMMSTCDFNIPGCVEDGTMLRGFGAHAPAGWRIDQVTARESTCSLRLLSKTLAEAERY